MRSFFVSLILTGFFFGLTGCDGAADGTPLKEVPPPDSRAAWVTAAGGGSVVLDDGARVDIPAGALTTDATVILERVTCDGYLRHDDFAGCLYAVRTEGDVTLAGRYTLTLPGGASDDTTEGACVLGDNVEGGRCQGDSTGAADGRITATASRFNTFVHRRPLQGGAVMPTLVQDLPFSVCDGDLLGDWNLVLIVAAFDSFGIGNWSGGEDFSDCAPFNYHKTRATEYHERLHITPPEEAGQAACLEVFRSYAVYEFTYMTQACMAPHDRTCSDSCTMVDGVCGCVIQKLAGEDGGGDCLLEDPDGDLHFDGDPNPLRHCVLGDTLTTFHEDATGPVLKIYRRQ